MKFLKKLVIFLFVFVFVGFLMAGVDYLKLSHGRVPIFCISSLNSKTHVETFRGIFYVARRTITDSREEPLVDSKDISFQILYMTFPISRNYQWEKLDFTVLTAREEECSSSKLYYADLNGKYYTYCLQSIKLKEFGQKKSKDLITYLEKDSQTIEDMVGYMDFVGIMKDSSTEKYVTNDESLSIDGLTIYRCNKNNINDVYIAPANVELLDDFCTYKDDDFSFLWKIEEKEALESSEEESSGPEVIYEDENYRYEFPKPKMARIFIVTPKVRGKARTETPLRQILDQQILTIDELMEKGLQCNKIDKQKEAEEMAKAENKES